MESWSFSGPCLTILAILAGIALLHSLWARKCHPLEPEVIKPGIPFIGHLLGIVFYGARYVKQIGRSRSQDSIFTLPVPGSRLYIVTDPSLASSVQRAKSLTFAPLVPDIVEKTLGIDKPSMRIIRRNVDPEAGEPRGFIADTQHLLSKYLSPGETLQSMSCTALDELARYVSSFAESVDAQDQDSSITTDLHHWIRHMVQISTGLFLYGPNNPTARSPELEQCFWDFVENLGGILLSPFPWITARKSYAAREKLGKAFEEYLAAGLYKEADEVVKRRIVVGEEHEMLLQGMARAELSFYFAAIINTQTTVFWILLHIFSRPSLLRTIRSEMKEALEAEKELTREDTISIESFKEACPTLDSVFRECLRWGSENISTRLVREDTILSNKYFLRKGSIVQVAGGVIHGSTSVWGKDATEFDPLRFRKSSTDKSASTHPTAFRAFGGGKTLCPGRHFAANEVLLLSALIIGGLNVEAPEGGDVAVPQKNDKVLPIHVLDPVGHVDVRLRVHDRSMLRRWKFVP